MGRRKTFGPVDPRPIPKTGLFGTRGLRSRPTCSGDTPSPTSSTFHCPGPTYTTDARCGVVVDLEYRGGRIRSTRGDGSMRKFLFDLRAEDVLPKTLTRSSATRGPCPAPGETPGTGDYRGRTESPGVKRGFTVRLSVLCTSPTSRRRGFPTPSYLRGPGEIGECGREVFPSHRMPPGVT